MNPGQAGTLVRRRERQKAAHVKTWMSGSMMIGLLFAAASCSGNSSDTAPKPVLSYPPVDAATLTSLQNRVVNITYDAAVARGVNIDPDCLRSVGAQFSEADAKLIDDANTNAAKPSKAEPTLSAQGSTLAAAVQHCVKPGPLPTTTTISASTTSTTNG
ncbi:MAG: hypothetical protein JWL72_1692 [Ilumatobacteraceae bacterium]|nr:hypothetical protein [Ilumatobacteraceae bacterium]MCU1388354.1 hypothetical protein [Ilumatobacteraceae bacterium]